MFSTVQKQIATRTGGFLLLACFLILSTSGLFAQTAGFGSISGVVQDSTGAVVGAAKVVVENSSKGIRREMETTDAGVFNAGNLVPADGYTIKISKQGFADYVAKDVTLQVGQNINLMPTLKIGSAGTEISVTGEAPVVDTAKSSVSTVVGSRQILELPINGRRVDAFVALTPGVSNDGNFGLLSFRGNPGGNTFLTDGIDTTNAYYGENAGRTRTYNISQDAVQEFQVVSANYAAEFGKAAGGVVNTVTRSGSNSFHGSAYEFYRNRTLHATDYTTKTSSTGLYPNGINPPEWRHQAGLSVGGPIVKDKLFFFFNGELFRRNAPLVSSNIGAGSGNNVFDGAGNVKTAQRCVPGGTVTLPSGVSVPGPTQAQCDAATSYATSRVVPQLVPRTMDNNMLFAKVDWHPTDKDSISFSGNYLDFRSPNGIQTQLSLTNGNGIGNNADTNVFDRTGRASWTRIVTPNSINEFRFGIFKDRQYDPASASLLPTFGSAGPSPAALTVNGVSNLGYATNYPRLNPSELRVQFADNYSWTVNKHTLKFGVDISHLTDYVDALYGQFPSYTYNSLTHLALDINGGTTVGNQAYSAYSQTTGNRVIDFGMWETSFYAQDDWRITPKLTLSPGIRVEHTGIPQPETCNPRFPKTCRIPENSNTNFAPRLGFAYALDEKTALRGGYGLFNNRYITSTIQNLFVTNGAYQYSYSYSGTSINPTTLACLPSFPTANPETWQPSGSCARNLSPGILWAGDDYRPSYSQQANIALEHELVKNVSISMSYVWSRSLHLPVSYDTNVLAPTTSRTYQILSNSSTSSAVASTYTIPVYTSFNPVYTFNGSQYTGRVSELESSANSYYNAMLTNVKFRRWNWFQGDVSYTWGHTIDWGVGFAPTFGSTTPSSFYNRDYRADKASSTLDRRHNLVFNYVFAPKFMSGDSAVAKYLVNGWQLSGVTLFASSQPQVPTISGSTPGLLTTFSINGLGGSSRVPFVSADSLNIGPVYRTDARITKTFPITERVNVMMGFEAFNVFNTLITSGRDTAMYAVSRPTTGPNAGLYVLAPRPSFGAISTTQITPDGTTARRAQALIRINF
ncbi:MAG TPA: TonB-dependent receptor [Terriglobales bacterium]|nr:TonB-dependent receptor [Terriglobales bacterium]